jgi:hypothetical protein
VVDGMRIDQRERFRSATGCEQFDDAAMDRGCFRLS